MARRLFFRLLRAARPDGDRVADSELLERFVRNRDSAAFELILRRHADAVWAACRRILPEEADAEDAFQATFLVLVRKAGSIRNLCVGGWLHRVAVNAALKVKASGQHQPATPELVEQAGHSSEERAEQSELAAALHEELARLPEKYRLPVVLCDLEGHSHAEAAAVLNWPVGSVSGRLSRAHALLRDRLARRGVAAPVLLAVASALTPLPANAIPTVAATAAGSIPVSPSVSILVQGVLTAMKTAKLKLTAWLVASCGLVALAGVGTVSAWPRTGVPIAGIVKPELPVETAAPVPAEAPIEGDWIQKKPGDVLPTAFPHLKVDGPLDLKKSCPNLFGTDAIEIEATDDTYRRLLKAQVHQGALALQLFLQRLEIGAYQNREFTALVDSLDSLIAPTIELWANDPMILKSRLEEFVLLAKYVERVTKVHVDIGTDPPHLLHAAHRHRLAVEAAVWKVLHAKPAGK